MIRLQRTDTSEAMFWATRSLRRAAAWSDWSSVAIHWRLQVFTDLALFRSESSVIPMLPVLPQYQPVNHARITSYVLPVIRRMTRITT